MYFKNFALVIGLLLKKAVAQSVPECDTTLAQRDAIRAAVLKSTTNNPFSESYEAKVTKFVYDNDSEGESFFYDFSATDLNAPDGNNDPRVTFLYHLPTVQDAILVIMCLPPKNTWEYFGITDVLVNYEAIGPGSPLVTWNPNAELGDSLNNLRIKSTAPEGVEEPWGYTSAIIHTPDKTSADKLTAALVEANFPQSAINVIVIPSLLYPDKITFGQDPSNSIFSSGFRVRSWGDNKDTANSWARSFAEPVLLLSNSSEIVSPIPTPTPIVRGSDVTENYLIDTLEDMKYEAIRQAEENGFVLTNEITTYGSPIMDPTNCFENFKNQTPGTCYQGSQDISYGFMDDTKSSISDTGYGLLLGAIHSRTGLATYSSIGYKLQGNVNTATLVGTADPYLESGCDIYKDRMFVLDLVHNCTAKGLEFCFSLDQDPTAERIISRSGLDPNTKTGPNFDDLVNPILLAFDKAPPNHSPQSPKSTKGSNRKCSKSSKSVKSKPVKFSKSKNTKPPKTKINKKPGKAPEAPKTKSNKKPGKAPEKAHKGLRVRK